MTRPEDISERAWEAAQYAVTCAPEYTAALHASVARAIDAETERAKAEQREADAKLCLDYPWEHQFISERYAATVWTGRSVLLNAESIAQAIRSPHV